MSQWRFNISNSLREAINTYCEPYWMSHEGNDQAAEWFIADRIWDTTVGQNGSARYLTTYDNLRARRILSADGYPLVYDAPIFDKKAPAYGDVRPAGKIIPVSQGARPLTIL